MEAFSELVLALRDNKAAACLSALKQNKLQSAREANRGNLAGLV